MPEVYSAIPLGPNFQGGSTATSSGRTNAILERFRNDRNGYFRTAVILGGLIVIILIISVIVHVTSSSSSLYYLNNEHMNIENDGGNVLVLSDYDHDYSVGAGADADADMNAPVTKDAGAAVPFSPSSSLRGSNYDKDSGSSSGRSEGSNQNLRLLELRSFRASEPKQEVQQQQQQQSPIIMLRQQVHEKHYLPEYGMHIHRSTTSTSMTQHSSSSFSSSTSSSFVQVITTTSTLHHDGDESLDYVQVEEDAEFESSGSHGNDYDGEESVDAVDIEEETQLDEPTGYDYSVEDLYASVHDSLKEDEEGESSDSIDEKKYYAADQLVEQEEAEESVEHEKIMNVLPQRMEMLRVG